MAVKDLIKIALEKAVRERSEANKRKRFREKLARQVEYAARVERWNAAQARRGKRA
jgi:hypothetical protein